MKRIRVVQSSLLLKGHGVYGHRAGGPAFLRAPPATAMKAPEEPDIPAFAHDGQGNIIEGQFTQGPHGEMVYATPFGDFRHGIDAVVNKLGEFFKARGMGIDPVHVVDKAIRDFNDNHDMPKNHKLNSFDNMSHRKIRVGPLQRGVGNDMPVNTHGGTQITHLHNKNADTAPLGKFIESAYWPAFNELRNVLTDIIGIPAAELKGMDFVKYPYIRAHDLAPHTYQTYEDHPSAEIPDKYRRFYPEGAFPDITGIHSWENIHELPLIAHYPKVGKKGKPPSKLKNSLNQHIDEAIAMGGVEAIPDVNITMNLGNLGAPDLRQVNLREALTNPNLRDDLANDIIRAPSLMQLFGRSGQGDMKALMDFFVENYGLGEEGLTLDQHKQYYTAGKGAGGQGTHTGAARLAGLAAKSGKHDSGRSNLSEHDLTEEDLQGLGLHYSPSLVDAAERYQIIIQALADHQAAARGHEVQRPMGDIPENPMMGASIQNYPEIDPETGMLMHEGMPPHMDPYVHRVEDYAPTSPSVTTELGVQPGRDAVAEPAAMPVEEQIPVAATTQTPIRPSTSHSVSPSRGVAVTPGMPLKPLHPAVSQARQAVGQYNPQQLREFMQAASMRQGEMPGPDVPFTPHEERFRQSFSDPRQTMLEQFARSEDTHLPIMDRVLKKLERIQMEDARNDNEISKHVKPHFRDSNLLAQHLGLTKGDVHTIAHATGDWYKIAKSFSVEPKVVKVIKVNQGA